MKQINMSKLNREFEKMHFKFQGHSLRVSLYMEGFFTCLFLHDKDIKLVNIKEMEALVFQMGEAGLYHDIGKVNLNFSIKKKNSPNEKEEAAKYEAHPEKGAKFIEALKGVSRGAGDKKYLESLRAAALLHHEAWDGSGFPYKLKERNIPLGARVCAIVNQYDELRMKKTQEEALEEIKNRKGKALDPNLVEFFLANKEKILIEGEPLALKKRSRK